jgi:hypothetical protein
LRDLAADLRATIQEARRPGGLPERLPVVPADLRCNGAIQVLVQQAEAAAADARRRHWQRVKKAAAAVRREEMETRLLRDQRAAWTWWRSYLADLDLEWDALE